VTVFYDPSVQFRLVFEVSLPPAAEAEPAAPAPKKKPEPAAAAAGDEPKVVSLDQFRKK
jgi:hypothetical protein